jgi:Putative prokaryotic signal transducing protein
VNQIVDEMQGRRERYGISYHVVPDSSLETVAPIVARLAGVSEPARPLAEADATAPNNRLRSVMRTERKPMRTCPNLTCPDRVRGGLAGEYIDSVEVCPQCGTPLVAGTPADRDDTPETAAAGDLELVSVLQTADEGLAALVKSILDADNIRYFVKGEGVQDLLGWGRIAGGFNYVVGPVEFLVRQDDVDRARALLTESEGVQGQLGESEDDP